MRVTIRWVLMIGSLAVIIGCTGQRPDRSAATIVEPAFVLRVHSSNGDIQPINVEVRSWLVEGSDVRAFEKKETPFDILLPAGNVSLHLASRPGGPEIRLQLLQNEQRALGYLQSREVCVDTTAEGEYALRDCRTGLR